jgi:hypothetical protein
MRKPIIKGSSTDLVVSLGKGKRKAVALSVVPSPLRPHLLKSASYRAFLHSQARLAVDVVLDMWEQQKRANEK